MHPGNFGSCFSNLIGLSCNTDFYSNLIGRPWVPLHQWIIRDYPTVDNCCLDLSWLSLHRMKIHLKVPNLTCWIWIKVFVIPNYLQPWYGIWLFSWPGCRQDLQYIHWPGQVGSVVSCHHLTNGTTMNNNNNNDLSSSQDLNKFILPYKAWLLRLPAG